ncbi:DUF3794 and LysM peptidoglycan-binding domain-containing protein [Defluviitalea phaphyphila]|uniref:DUF3794 and LysM peptidoglycan-binding domain-containing protein n=1 Tax=Defluviitalea phaphyphila TaxID=1473580 RepID=UPI00073013C4|nr:SPOCS domain-containing protein [Defluviitalea phaphyphila]
MALEFIKDSIEFDQQVCKEKVQVIVEEDIIVPDVKPDIVKVLQLDGKVNLEQVEIFTDRLNYRGEVKVCILYAAEGSDRLVHSMVVSLPLDDFINMDGIKKEMTYTLEHNLEHLDFMLINSRKLTIKALVEIEAKVAEKIENEIIVGVNSSLPIQIQKKSFDFYRTIAANQDKMIIKDELSVPTGKPNIHEILNTDIKLCNKEFKVGNGVISLKGDLNIKTLYAGSMTENQMDYMEHQIPFNGTIECPGAKEGMFCNIDIKMINEYIQVRPDLDGEERILDVEVVLLVNAKAISMEEVQIIDDAYCPGKNIKLEKKKLLYKKILNKNRENILLNENISLDSDALDIDYIYNVKVKPNIEEIKLMENKIFLEGVFEIELVYITQDNEEPICNYETIIPFNQSLEAEKSNIDKKVEIQFDIDDILCNLISKKDVEIKIILGIDFEIIDEQETDIITDMTEEDIDPNTFINMPSLIIYMVQDGDTLWKIAKKYNSTIEELVSINDIEDPDNIYPGQKLLIIKKVVTG